MNFSFVIKSIFLSFFIFILIYAISYASTGKINLNGNNFGIKNAVKESLNIGELRTSGEVTYNEKKLIESTINNYVSNNPISSSDIKFDISVNNGIVTININSKSFILGVNNYISDVFSYRVNKIN